MPKKKNRYKIWVLCSIIIAATVAAVTLALIITNCFIPVKYLPAYFTVATENREGEMRVSFIDVGYGDCTIVEFPDGKTLLIDGGNGNHSNNLKVLTELNKRGITTIDYLVCSSVSSERCGGLTDILKYKKVLNAYTPYCPFTYVTKEYRSFVIELANRNLTPETLEYGKGVFNDEAGYSFCVLSPSINDFEDGEIDDFNDTPTMETINDASAVIFIEYGGYSFLLTGNVGERVLDKLTEIAKVGFEINGRTVDISSCSVFNVPCHGAPTSRLDEFLKIVSPKHAVLSVGDNGRAGPSSFTISDVQNCVGENFYRTDDVGTVTFTVTSDGLQIEKEIK